MTGLSDRWSDRPSDRVEPASEVPAGLRAIDNDSLRLIESFVNKRGRVTAVYVAQLLDRLSPRDVGILRDLASVRCLTGRQLERLHFDDLGDLNRDRARRRVLNRLVGAHCVTTLARRIGGVRAGSGGLVYCLDVAGQRVLRLLDGEDDLPGRRPWTPGLLFMAHTLAVAELFVDLREAERAGDLELSRFLAEPGSWLRTTSLGTLKPDAYALLAHGDIEDAWDIEVDNATESRATLRRKFDLYLLAAQAGVTGPDQVLPRVLVTVPDERRLAVVREIIDGLPQPAAKLVVVTLHSEAVAFMTQVLRE